MEQLLRICSSSHLEENDIEINTALRASSEQEGDKSGAVSFGGGSGAGPQPAALCLISTNCTLQPLPRQRVQQQTGAVEGCVPHCPPASQLRRRRRFTGSVRRVVWIP